MCGLVAVLSFKQAGMYMKDREIMEDLLVFNSVRGSHSTGIFAGRIDEPADYAKIVGNPYDLFNHPDASKIWARMIPKYKYMVGHGRWATRGKITSENAHPFQEDHITMVHNGTIHPSKLVKVADKEVDSHALAHALSIYDAADVLGDVNGAYAVIWHDLNEKTLNFARNKERPLWFGLCEKDSTILVSSEKNMLLSAAIRNNVQVEETFQLSEDTIFTFKHGNMDFSQRKVTPKKVYIPPPSKPYVPQTSTNVLPIRREYENKVKLVALTSPSTKNRIEVGQKILFNINEIHDISNRNGISTYHVFGVAVDFPELEVSFVWKSEEETLQKNKTWEGVVSSLHVSHLKPKNPVITHYTYLSGVKPVSAVETYDGTYIDKKEFLEKISVGCYSCGVKLSEEESTDVLISDDYVLCSKCATSYFSNLIEAS